MADAKKMMLVAELVEKGLNKLDSMLESSHNRTMQERAQDQAHALKMMELELRALELNPEYASRKLDIGLEESKMSFALQTKQAELEDVRYRTDMNTQVELLQELFYSPLSKVMDAVTTCVKGVDLDKVIHRNIDGVEKAQARRHESEANREKMEQLRMEVRKAELEVQLKPRNRGKQHATIHGVFNKRDMNSEQQS